MAAPYIVALQKSAEDLRRMLLRGLDVPATPDAWSGKILVADSLDHEALHRVQLALLDDQLVPPSRTMLLHRAPCAGAERALVAMGIGDVIEESPQALDVIRSRLQRWEQVDAALRLPLVTENLVGSSPAWMAALRTVAFPAGLSGSVKATKSPRFKSSALRTSAGMVTCPLRVTTASSSSIEFSPRMVVH